MDGLVRVEGPGHLSVRRNVDGHAVRNCNVYRRSWSNVIGGGRLLNMHRWGLCSARRGLDLRNLLLRSAVATVERVKTILQVLLGFPARNVVKVLCTALITNRPGARLVDVAATVSAESGTLLELLDLLGLKAKIECTTRAGSGGAPELQTGRCHLVVHLSHGL